MCSDPDRQLHAVHFSDSLSGNRFLDELEQAIRNVESQESGTSRTCKRISAGER